MYKFIDLKMKQTYKFTGSLAKSKTSKDFLSLNASKWHRYKSYTR